MMNKWLLLLCLLFPTPLIAQTYTACPKPGNRLVTVTANSLSATVPISIKEFAYNGATPFITERYSYATVSQMQQSSGNGRFYGSSQALTVDSTCGVLRMKLNPAEHTGPTVCMRYYTGYDLNFPSPRQEVFIEMYVKFDLGFVPARPVSDSTAYGCGGNYSGFVMLMGRVDNGSGSYGVVTGTHWPWTQRWEIGAACHFEWPITSTWTKQDDEEWRLSCGHHILSAAYQFRVPDSYPEFHTKLMKYDGKWHRYRFWFKAGNTAPNLGGVGVWIDNEHMGTLSIQDVTTDNLIGLSIGRFMWQVPVKQQGVEYGRIRVWNTNPGWNLCEKFCT